MKKPLTTWAQLRFSIIGALLARPPSNLGKAFERLAGKRYRHPTQCSRPDSPIFSWPMTSAPICSTANISARMAHGNRGA
jgi:hypothetical protein